ncbi:helix-turn-helix domain-containing protein [Shouchella patagoniensis]|uniref:helix-turn-helix domain-containing protein n=1 Tax=Shouchella patagoniensis TaxID=228576 RepID=UPI000994C146|nr:helix-turn-helix transcriptional regulator [Shouchella patagoniensis]
MDAVKETSIGLYLKTIRKEKGFTIIQAAERSSVSTAQISRLETGERLNPTLETLMKLSNAYELELEEVLKVGGYI